ncbi:DUF1868 domain-containing protein [Synechocystis sp. LKSZ1]|uniref:DUF1868 domain-containing protein n=1 Tax=Synechocystis sp. LKSZ1 TaxID=3144951 RepID=UPI00336BE55B
MDDTYQIYVNRVARLTLPASYQSQLANIQPSPKFQQGQPLAFPGYSIITPPAAEDSLNTQFYHHLSEVQQEVSQCFGQRLNTVPQESFHLTIADLIWDAQYQGVLAENPHFETQLKACIQKSFEQYQPTWAEDSQVQWQILGLLILPRALAVALVPRTEADYPPILQLRRLLYQSPDLITLGIEQQYHYTAHITLGYFGEALPTNEIEALTEQLSGLNDRWLELTPQTLQIAQVELRHFKDMTTFLRQADYPQLSLRP